MTCSPSKSDLRPPHGQTEAIAVAAAIIRKDERFLLAQRRNGFWEFPGGKQEAEESLAEALKREIKEELAVEVEVEKPFVTVEHVYPDKAIRLHTFFCRIRTGRLEAKECRDFRWVFLKDMENRRLLAADRKVVTRLLEFISSE